MNVYTPSEVYKNTIKMLGYRNVAMTGPALTDDALVQKLNHYEYVTIGGSRGDSTECTFIIIAPGSKYATKSGDFKKILRGMKVPLDGFEIMFISEFALTVHIKKQLNAFRAANPKFYVEDYDYEKFMIEVPRHVLVPKHEIMPEDEVLAYCNANYTSREKFQKILSSDTMAVWIGAKPGMVVRITRVSETAGYFTSYRYCIR